MKITSGIYKGRALEAPKNAIKPTSEMVRQAVINIVRPSLAGARFLDLYAGTGSVGIEALSAGASFACFVESHYRTYVVLKLNLDAIVGEPDKYRTFKHNALEISGILEETGETPFDFVFADPFYRDTKVQFDRLYELAMKWLSPGGLFILEHGEEMNFSIYKGYRETRNYGGTYLSQFVKEASK